MNLWLLQEENGAYRCIITEGNDRKNLRYTETDIGDQHLRRVGMTLDPYLEELTLRRDWPDDKTLDKIQFLEPLSDPLFKCQVFAPPGHFDLMAKFS